MQVEILRNGVIQNLSLLLVFYQLLSGKAMALTNKSREHIKPSRRFSIGINYKLS